MVCNPSWYTIAVMLFRKQVTTTVEKTIDKASFGVQTIENELTNSFAPVRRTVLERFPILFVLLTTFGVAAVFFGFERILAEIAYLNNRPWLILAIGLFVLLSTGSLYKVLGQEKRK